MKILPTQHLGTVRIDWNKVNAPSHFDSQAAATKVRSDQEHLVSNGTQKGHVSVHRQYAWHLDSYQVSTAFYQLKKCNP